MKQKISLNGVIDMHVHAAPDVCQRTYNDLELTAAAVRAGARAIVIKGHHCSTVARAALCNAYNRMAFDSNAFVMYGGLALNYEAGGLNPKAVQTALEMGAKVIWLPTVDAENDCRKHGRSGGIRMTDSRGVLLPELRRIFMLIKDYDAVLATGHISPEEIRCVIDSARNVGVQKIVITHPEYWVVDMSLEMQKELISDYNVVLERCFMQPLKNGRWVSNAERNLGSHTEARSREHDPIHRLRQSRNAAVGGIYAAVSAVYGRPQCQPGRTAKYDQNHAHTALGTHGYSGINERYIVHLAQAVFLLLY